MTHGDGHTREALLDAAAAEPSQAIDSVVRDYIEPHESMLVEVLRVLVPDADRPAAGRPQIA